MMGHMKAWHNPDRLATDWSEIWTRKQSHIDERYGYSLPNHRPLMQIDLN